MRLNVSFTKLAVMTLLAAGFSACAGNTPRKPAAEEKTAQSSALDDRCYDAYSRNLPPPAGCPADSNRTRNRRGLGLPEPDALGIPQLPGLGLPDDRPLLGR